MLTPKDIADPKLSSGYRHVRYERVAGRPKPYVAETSSRGKAKGATIQVGPHRATNLEAAEDYCAWYNSLPNLTPKDIENPKRKSGYDHVAVMDKRSVTDSGKISNPFRADFRPSKRFGARRATAIEAAQDYCDYVNGLAGFQPARLKSAGHNYSIPSVERTNEVELALGVLRDARAQRKGVQGYVYAITEDGCGEYVKLGYSVNPQKRLAELQTGNPRKLVLLGFKEGTPADERALHAKYIKVNVLQEWFKLDPSMVADFKKEVKA